MKVQALLFSVPVHISVRMLGPSVVAMAMLAEGLCGRCADVVIDR
jgi:hypothetical protein